MTLILDSLYRQVKRSITNAEILCGVCWEQIRGFFASRRSAQNDRRGCIRAGSTVGVDGVRPEDMASMSAEGRAPLRFGKKIPKDFCAAVLSPISQLLFQPQQSVVFGEAFRSGYGADLDLAGAGSHG